MLNHIWLWMIILSILIAAGTDFYNEAINPDYGSQTEAESAWFFQISDIDDPAGLIRKIGKDETPVSKYMRSLFTEEMRKQLAEYNSMEKILYPLTPAESLQTALVTELNRLIKDKNIYNEVQFANIQLTDEIKKLIDNSPRGIELMRLNRLLLEAAYPKKLVKMRNLNEDTKLGQVTTAAIDAAGLAIKIAIGLIGVMALWLGVMKVAEEAGMIRILARIVQPITKRLFPSIPSDHPSIGAMIMNIAANMLGLSNAATPLGLKAMEELDKLNPKKGEATDDMITFLVINTSAITVVPATAIAIRASLGSANPQKIVIPAILAASMATIVGVTTVKLIQYFQRKRRGRGLSTDEGGQNGTV